MSLHPYFRVRRWGWGVRTLKRGRARTDIDCQHLEIGGAMFGDTAINYICSIPRHYQFWFRGSMLQLFSK